MGEPQHSDSTAPSPENNIRRLFRQFAGIRLEGDQRPRLVIRLMHSLGTLEWLKAEEYPIPWKSDEEASDAENKLTQLFMETVIPLARTTNAIVILNALDTCMLSAAFMRAYKVYCKSRLHGMTQFTVIGVANLRELYVSHMKQDRNPQEMKWQSLRKIVGTWDSRHKDLEKEYKK